MAKFVIWLPLGLVLISNLAIAQVTTAKERFIKNKTELLKSFDSARNNSRDSFENSKLIYALNFDKIKQDLAKLWDIPQLTNKSVWVQYSRNNTIRRSVDFESGNITVEILGDDLSSDEVSDIVWAQLTELETETTTQAYKKDKVVSSGGPAILAAKDKMLQYVNIPALTSSAKISSSKQNDGVTVTSVSMRYPKNDIQEIAMMYLPSVMDNSTKWGVSPELIFAIMHTESHFNPMAQSHIPAFGLMQIVPTSAGRDVTKHYLGKEILLPDELLFNPEFNIEIGSCYINILQSHYLAAVKNTETRTYLVVAAYNGGIGAVAKHFTGATSLSGLAETVNALDPAFVYDSLTNNFPAFETRNYLKKVTSKLLPYKIFISERMN